jgi:hypothetical protein
MFDVRIMSFMLHGRCECVGDLENIFFRAR